MCTASSTRSSRSASNTCDGILSWRSTIARSRWTSVEPSIAVPRDITHAVPSLISKPYAASEMPLVSGPLLLVIIVTWIGAPWPLDDICWGVASAPAVVGGAAISCCAACQSADCRWPGKSSARRTENAVQKGSRTLGVELEFVGKQINGHV